MSQKNKQEIPERKGMERIEITPLQHFVHDVAADAGILRSAAKIFEGYPPQKRDEFLRLMSVHAEKLAKRISDYRKKGC